ncbi:MAG TPA: hypothetical protein OIM37_06795 [Clostridiales bacterium]|nr:hypothetical protein [Clostridiales bacterium]
MHTESAMIRDLSLSTPEAERCGRICALFCGRSSGSGMREKAKNNRITMR